MPSVAFLLSPGVHLLDLAGPAQVFSELAEIGFPRAVHYLGEHPEITSAQGLPVRAGTEWPALDAGDLLVVPGWATRGGPPDAGRLSSRALEYLRAHHGRGGTVASVCSGADALGRAGLLDGRRFTTHHALAEAMGRRYPGATLVRDVLFVSDGGVLTSAGIASGIDLALHLVARWHGPAVAARVARAMVVFARRNGEQPQASAMLRHRGHLVDAVHRVQDVIDARPADRLPLAELAALAGTSERTLTRAFVRATGGTPLHYQRAVRLERARHLLDRGETAERAARLVGFSDARSLRRLRARARAEPPEAG